MQLQSNFEALCSKLQHLLNVYRCQVTKQLNFFITVKTRLGNCNLSVGLV